MGGASGTLDTLHELAEALADDADFATTMTNALALKAPLASPSLTGEPTAPTAAPGTDNTRLATTAFATLVASAQAAKSKDRPGDNPSIFSAAITGDGTGKEPLSGTASVVDGLGLCYMQSGAGTIALRDPVAISTDVWEFSARFKRTSNPSDPNNHAIQLNVAWLDGDKAQIGSVETLATKSDALTSSGLVELSARVSALAVDDVTAPPSGAVYACPFVQTYGDDGVTAIETLRATEVTDLHAIESADLSALITQTEAARDAASAAAELVNTAVLDTFADITSWSRPSGTGAVTFKGGYAAYDGLGGSWVYDPDDTTSTHSPEDGVLVTADDDRFKPGAKDPIPSIADYAASSALTDAENRDILKAVLDALGVALVPIGVTFDQDRLNPPIQSMVLDLEKAQIVFGNTALRGGAQGSHVSVLPLDTGGAAAIYIQPSDWSLINQVAALKGFLEPYDKLLIAGGEDIATYRDFSLAIENDGGHNGAGIIKLNAQGGGHLAPWSPDFHIGCFKNGVYQPFRVLWAQGQALPAGNYFAGGVAAFEPGKLAWRTGMSVVQGQLLTQGTGRVYEVQSAGTTGSTRPVHATYQMWQVEVADSSGYIVGEVVDEGAGSSFPRGTVYSKPDATHIIVYAPNDELLDNGFNAAATLTGATSATAQTIASTGTVNVDVDLDPSGGPNQQINAPAVSGRTVSDGGVDLMFLDDVTGGNTDNEPFHPILVFGDEDSTPVYFDPRLRFQFLDYNALFRNGAMTLEDYPLTMKGAGVEATWQETSGNKTWSITIVNGSGNVEMHDDEDDGLTYYRANKALRTEGVAMAGEWSNKDNGATTFDATGTNYVKVNDTAATNFTEITGGVDTQPLTMRFNTANTTLVESANLRLGGLGNLTPAAKAVLTFVRVSSGEWSLDGFRS